MRRIAHASCGYSEYAPGCDDAACLLHRLEVAVARGWDAAPLQRRLDAVVDTAAAHLLGDVPSQVERSVRPRSPRL